MTATTPRLALPYPVAADTADVPRDISALATRLETLVDPTSLALPSTPYDGQVAYLSPATGVVWAFRWNNSGTTYKWEFCGGPALLVPASANLAVASSTASAWVDDAGQPVITAPRAGVYQVRHGMTPQSTAIVNQDVWYTPPAGTLTQGNILIGSAVLAPQTFEAPLTLTTAGSVLKTRMMTGTGGIAINVYSRYLALTPVRVA